MGLTEASAWVALSISTYRLLALRVWLLRTRWRTQRPNPVADWPAVFLQHLQES